MTSTDSIRTGDTVRFHHQTWERTGTVTHTTPTRCTIAFALNDGTPRTTVKRRDEVTVVGTTVADAPPACGVCGETGGTMGTVSGHPEVGKVHGRCVGRAIGRA